MRGFILTVLPTVALAAVASLDPRQTLRIVNVVGAKSLGGDGCPDGWFYFKPNGEDPREPTTGTLNFGKYVASVGPETPISDREKFCDFEVTLEFPLGCTSGNIHVNARGYVEVNPGTEAVFISQNTVNHGSLGATNPPEIRFKESDKDYLRNFVIPVRQNVLENQRNVTLTSRTRIFVVQPGPAESASFALDQLEFSVKDATPTC